MTDTFPFLPNLAMTTVCFYELDFDPVFDIKVFVMLSNLVYLMERRMVSQLCHWAYDHTLVIIVITNINIKLLKLRWDRVMTQQNRPLAPEDPGWFLIPEWQLTISCNCRSRGSNAPFWPPLASGVHVVTMQTEKLYTDFLTEVSTVLVLCLFAFN